MAPRFVVLFARAPRREAREKGLDGRAGEELFGAFAAGWISAARRAGARVVLASAPGDRPAWRRALPGADVLFVEQRGDSFGERLHGAARDAAALGGRTVVVGGDVPPSAELLRDAFEHLDRDAEAVLAAAPDGGVSLLAFAAEDLDLLRWIAPRRRDVFVRLCERLRARGRRVAFVASVPDVDGRRRLRSLLAWLPLPLRQAARRALLAARCAFTEPRPLSLLSGPTSPTGLRAPPAAA
jgi:glycosyltransferase A (GT-A) superfamily protein (DUF2064 family)